MKKLFLFLIFLYCYSLSWGSVHSHKEVSRHESKIYDCFTINTTAITIKASSCGSKDGSVIGTTINGDGKFTYTWKDVIGNTVGNNLDLKNVSGGTYTLEVKQGEDCPKQAITITIDEKNGIVTDLTNVKVAPAGCDNKGSVLGIKITGASRLEWRSFTTGTIVSTTEDLVNMPIGIYKLTAYNETGCVKDAGTFTISSLTVLPNVDKIDIEDPSCGMPTGNVTITLTVFPDQERLQYYVGDSLDRIVKDGLIQFNGNSNTVISMKLGEGPYRMFVRGSSGCDVLLTSFKVNQNILSLVSDSIGVVNDQCNQRIGRILGIQFKGMTKPKPRSLFEWTNAEGESIGENLPYLLNIGAGKYTLHVTDPGGCELYETFTVLNTSPDLMPPKVSDIDICLPGNVTLFSENVDTAGSYRLYVDYVEGALLIAENKNGKFNMPVAQTTNFYVSYLQGICESAKTLVTVNVAAPGINIPNTFTPNGDGINDNWNITALENYPGTIIQIYNRYGNIVYNSLNYTTPFDGRKDGKELPEGVYFYKIEIKRISCEGKIRGSLTILR